MKSIAIVGYSSTGKTTGLRNLPPKETVIVSPYKEDLPIPAFRKNYTLLSKANPEGNFIKETDVKKITRIVRMINDTRSEIHYIVLEDFTHFFNKETLSKQFRDKGKGKENWSRWGDFGADIYQALFGNNSTGFRDDLWIITHFHPESYYDASSPNGEKLKIKTPGNLLEREVDIPSYYNYVFYTKVLPYKEGLKQSDRYFYITNDDGTCGAKSSIGCFNDLYIPNDLKEALDKIDKYLESSN